MSRRLVRCEPHGLGLVLTLLAGDLVCREGCRHSDPDAFDTVGLEIDRAGRAWRVTADAPATS